VPPSATQPFTAFPGTSSYASLPTISFVTPNICHDMGTCPITTGNAWLQNRLGAHANWAVDNNSLLVVTFAEDDGSHGNHIPTIFYGAQVKPGNYSETINHYSLLRTLEDAYRLPHDANAAGATPITDCWIHDGPWRGRAASCYVCNLVSRSQEAGPPGSPPQQEHDGNDDARPRRPGGLPGGPGSDGDVRDLRARRRRRERRHHPRRHRRRDHPAGHR
jgi:hypothetical protein